MKAIIQGTLGTDIYNQGKKLASKGDTVKIYTSGNGYEADNNGNRFPITPAQIRAILYKV
jgi:hypothetical protein